MFVQMKGHAFPKGEILSLLSMISQIKYSVLSLFHYIFPLGKGGVLYLNKLESVSPRDTLCQVWLKLAQ